MSEIDDDVTPGEGAENNDLAQLSQADSLIDRGVADPLDEGYVPPDHWSPAQGFGNTEAEMARRETIEQRLPQEEPEPSEDTARPDWNPDDEQREVGGRRAGRLVAPDAGLGEDTESQSVAHDVGISGGAASAEEAAMHVIEDGDGEDDESSAAHHR